MEQYEDLLVEKTVIEYRMNKIDCSIDFLVKERNSLMEQLNIIEKKISETDSILSSPK